MLKENNNMQINIKRGLKANLPVLAQGEFAFCTDTKELFIGTSGGINTLFGKSEDSLSRELTFDWIIDDDAFGTLKTEEEIRNFLNEDIFSLILGHFSGTLSIELTLPTNPVTTINLIDLLKQPISSENASGWDMRRILTSLRSNDIELSSGSQTKFLFKNRIELIGYLQANTMLMNPYIDAGYRIKIVEKVLDNSITNPDLEFNEPFSGGFEVAPLFTDYFTGYYLFELYFASLGWNDLFDTELPIIVKFTIPKFVRTSDYKETSEKINEIKGLLQSNFLPVGEKNYFSTLNSSPFGPELTDVGVFVNKLNQGKWTTDGLIINPHIYTRQIRGIGSGNTSLTNSGVEGGTLKPVYSFADNNISGFSLTNQGMSIVSKTFQALNIDGAMNRTSPVVTGTSLGVVANFTSRITKAPIVKPINNVTSNLTLTNQASAGGAYIGNVVKVNNTTNITITLPPYHLDGTATTNNMWWGLSSLGQNSPEIIIYRHNTGQAIITGSDLIDGSTTHRTRFLIVGQTEPVTSFQIPNRYESVRLFFVHQDTSGATRVQLWRVEGPTGTIVV
jgi:hypothetical protein